MLVLSKVEATRAEINLRNLQRHDAAIDKIITSTSYVTVYYNDGAEWIKTGIEGPMFLFSRSQQPQYGFFVLNRQGLEYTQEFLTDESDVKVEGEFILYEPRPDADRATGIWIAEEKDRVELCRRMEELRLRAKPPIAGAKASPLDFLFASVSPQSGPSPMLVSSPQPAPAVLPKATPSTLDMLFASSAADPVSSAPKSPPKPTSPPAPASPSAAPAGSLSGLSLLDTLFKSASPRAPAEPALPDPARAKPKDARDLLAMIGHPAGSAPVHPPASSNSPISPTLAPAATPVASVSSPPAPTAPPASTQSRTSEPSTAPRPTFAPPLLSHDVFANLPPIAGMSKKPATPKPSLPAPAPAPAPAPTTARAPASPVNAPAAQKPTTVEPSPHDVTKASNRMNTTAATASSMPISPVESRGSATASPRINRTDALEVVDAAANKARVGLGAHEKEPLDQKAFIKSLSELMQRPAFATSLYARYLERFEDDHEA